ncbi:cyclic AMP-dependent transcription factor ATF-2 [Contarinia nasturtii]|uniref:cyclic AMP-dependent transcription factor ATF-2 n=1 Tax=Contarinia nasturtii TaxID=265458 RepID=UPI0012D3A83B|nr:cyclic AMP-dependent transcription factor ATF-2 [Contarinia nasturtii]
MDEMKSNLLTPEILEECLNKETCFNVIKHNRDITLSLNSGDENKNNSKYIADQTPTPTTRLIRNCEEFGLFDDLKHVNPFEETFRQAIDDKTKRPSVLLTTQKSHEIIKCNDEDTLHTPHIIPYNTIDCNDDDKRKNDPDALRTKETNTNKQPVVIPVIVSNDSVTSSSIIVSTNEIVTNTTTTVVDNKESLEQITGKIKIIENDEIAQKVFRKICPKPTVVPLVTNVSNPIKEKIRKSLMKLRTTRNNDNNEFDAKVPATVKTHISTAKESHVKDIPKEEIKRQVLKRGTILHDNSINERNREAAKRYRNKQKMRHDALIERNAQLEAENSILKKQLQALKKAHENCSVSRLYDI